MLLEESKISIWVCGRRWGKSILIALSLLKTALEYPGSRSWYIANDYALCLEQKRMMLRCQDLEKLVSHNYSQFPPRLEFHNGSSIAFRSCDRPELLRGAGLKKFAYDEAGSNNNGGDLVEAILMPMIADSDGVGIIASTYNGRNWFYDMAEKGKKWTPGAMVRTWVYPTSSGYAFQDEGGKRSLAELKSITSPMKWRQEYECEPLAVEDTVFEFVDQCITPTVPQDSPEPYRPNTNPDEYIVSQDIGRVVDCSGVVVLECETGIVVHSETYPKGMLHKDQAQRTLALSQKWNRATVVLDTTGGASGGKKESNIKYYEDILPDFEAITWTIDTKRNMVNHLALEFEQKKIWIPECFGELISQLRLYRYRYSETALCPIFFGRPDDLVAALLMASWQRKVDYVAISGRRTKDALYEGTI